MPLYEYQCTQCGHRLELIEKFSDDPATECPECGSLLERLLSAPAIQFKGSGWYITDYSRKDGSATKESKSRSGESGEKSSDKKDSGSSSGSGSDSNKSSKSKKSGD